MTISPTQLFTNSNAFAGETGAATGSGGGLFGQVLDSVASVVLQTGNAVLTNVVELGGSAYSQLPPAVTKYVVGADAWNKHNVTPTVGQFNEASLMMVVNPDATPPSLTPFMVNGKQMKFVDTQTGCAAEAWKTASNQVIVVYDATDPVSPWGTSFYDNQLLGADLAASKGEVAPAETQSLTFLKQVQAAAAAQGINPQKGVFTTGYSLGGIEAEYASEQTGVGGLAIASTGLPQSTLKGAGSGSNFVNLLAAGDPVSQLDNVIGADPKTLDTGLQHYGENVQTGAPVLNTVLQGLSNLLLSGAPTNGSRNAYFLQSFLGAGTAIAGDPTGLAYLGPTQVPLGLFGVLNHGLGAQPLAIQDAADTLPQFKAANDAQPA